MEYFAWPAVVLIIAIVFIGVFRKQISSLILGIRSLNLPGVKATTNQEQFDLSERNKTSEKLLKAFDNQLLLDQEKKIMEGMELNSITDDKEKVKILSQILCRIDFNFKF